MEKFSFTFIGLENAAIRGKGGRVLAPGFRLPMI